MVCCEIYCFVCMFKFFQYGLFYEVQLIDVIFESEFGGEKFKSMRFFDIFNMDDEVEDEGSIIDVIMRVREVYVC